MTLRVTILGSGTSLPSTKRMAPAYWVQAEGASLLLDCGSGSTTSLVRQGGRLENLTGVALTHLHPDHVADLLPLLFALFIPMRPRREEDLYIWGPKGTQDYLDALGKIYGPWIKPLDVAAKVIELRHGEVCKLGALQITPFFVTHTERSFAYRIESSGSSFCFSGDSGPCLGLEEAARGVDLFICECAALEDELIEGHMRASDVGHIANAALCREVVLTHLYEHVAATDPVSRVKEFYSGPVRLAEDGMVFSL